MIIFHIVESNMECFINIQNNVFLMCKIQTQEIKIKLNTATKKMLTSNQLLLPSQKAMIKSLLLHKHLNLFRKKLRKVVELEPIQVLNLIHLNFDT